MIKKIKQHKRAVLAVVAGVAVILLLVGVIVVKNNLSEKGEVVYREAEAVYGDLTVGITENGSVDIGTVEQTFDLDISELVRAEFSTGNSSGGASMGGSGMGGNAGGMMGGQGGANMFGQIFDFAGQSGQNATGQSDSIGITEVKVSVGTQVKEGDVLYVLDEEKVEELRERLQSDVEKAAADLELVYAQQKESLQSAEHTLASSLAYGDYAQTEYNQTITSLTEMVETKQESLAVAKEELQLYESRLAEVMADYEIALGLLADATWCVENTDKVNNTYLYVEYVELQTEARSNVTTLENEISQQEKNIENAQKQVENLETEVEKAIRSLASGRLTAKQTYDLRMLAYKTAQETYDIAVSYLEETGAEQEETYAAAAERWEEFGSQIDGNSVCAAYNGVVTDVALEVGDSLSTGETLITLYDLDDVTMTVTVAEEDMTDIAVGSAVNVSFTAYPDRIFTALVSEIGDAASSGGEVTYEVTVSLKGDVSGLYQSMTGELTFITKETREVLYVPNRAIIRKSSKSYVKIKEDGNVKTVEVVTGFSDGVNVEIKKGLSEGDTVLIESKVED